MLKTVLKIFKKKSQEIIHSIAFYPVLISFAFLIVAIGSLQIENLEFVSSIKKKIPYLFIEDYETARSILSTIIGGILSLTVFSFSMVMVVLNQASSNFSPRLLPNLISNKKHQIILGFYIGTLLYCIIILTTLGAYGVDSDSLGLSTMLAALASLICIGLFVYFINSISIAIQIHNIIDKIYNSTSNYLDVEFEHQKENMVIINSINSEKWTIIKNKKTGYYRGFDISLLKDSLKNSENHIEVLPYTNEHIWKGMPVLKIKNSVSKTELENLIFCMNISSDRHEGDQGITGMIKLMEIAVKAMSPGINDPGTAIDAINKLGQLLCKFLQFPAIVSKPIANNNLMITKHTICAAELNRIVIQPIRLYSKQDNSVLYVLIKSLQFITTNPHISQDNKAVVKTELKALKVDIEQNIKNQLDKENLLKLLRDTNSNI